MANKNVKFQKISQSAFTGCFSKLNGKPNEQRRTLMVQTRKWLYSFMALNNDLRCEFSWFLK